MKKAPTKMGHKSAAKMGHKSAAKMKKAPTKFNAKLRAAKAAGKLDDNPKFKAAVKIKKMKASAMTMKKAAMKLKKESTMKLKKSAMMLKKSAMMIKKASSMKMGHKK